MILQTCIVFLLGALQKIFYVPKRERERERGREREKERERERAFEDAQDSLGVAKVLAPSKNPAKCPIICFAREKKIISRTFKIIITINVPLIWKALEIIFFCGQNS